MFILDQSSFDLCYGPEERQAIAERVEIIAPLVTPETVLEHRASLREVEIILSGWGAPLMDAEFLAAAPKLKAVFYAGGSVAEWMTQEVWDRGIVVSSAYAANAIPVAEYTLSVIIFSLKHGWKLTHGTRAQRRFLERNGAPGCYRRSVGLISLGVTGRAVRRLLRALELKVLAYDPYVSAAEAQELGVEMVSLDELFGRCDVVSLHTPLLPETEGMIRGTHLSAMRPGATFVNTARGAIVRQDELIETALGRPDLQFVLDVTDPDPLDGNSLLYTLDNVVVTPHIAGSVGEECRRMARYMVDELVRFLEGKPLCWQVTPELAWNSSHRPLVQRNTHALRKAVERARAGVEISNAQGRTHQSVNQS
jgi:phosphoglycerate dehydrogenase-like enzyme